MRYLVLMLILTGCPDNPTSPANNIPSDTGDMVTRDAIAQPDSKFDISDIPPVDGRLVRTPTQDNVSPDGHADVDDPTGPNVARVGRLSTDGGFHGIWAHCKPGDFKLYNNEVEFCIQGFETNRYEFFRGGLLVDARRLGDPEEDEFDVLTFRKDLGVFHPEEIYVVRDGSDGQAAVLRADGIDMPIAHFVGAISPQPFRWNELKWTVEYRLRPDSDVLEIVTWISRNVGAQENVDAGDVVGFGDRFRIWAPSSGFNSGMIDETNFVVGFNAHQTFGWISPQKTNQFSIPFGEVPWYLSRGIDQTIEEDRELAEIRWLALSSDLEDLHRTRNQLLEIPELPEQQVVVRRQNGMPIVGMVIEVRDTNDVPIALTRTDNSGVIRFSGEPGTYTFALPERVGIAPRVETAEVPAEIVVSDPGGLDINVEVNGEPVTAQVNVSNAVSSHRYVSDHVNPFPIVLEPGVYQITVDKGMEYDFLAADVTIVAGQTTKILVPLNRVVDTTDFIAADFHQHLEPSIDSNVSITDRILDNVAQGLDFVTPTDHEVVTDMRPYIDAIGATLSTAPGVEVSPVPTHVNLFPMAYQENERARGSIPLAVIEDGEPVQRTIPEMLDLARNHPSAPVIQINHGRGSSGFFSRIDHDPALDPLLNEHPDYTTEYDAMEVVNEWNTTCDLFTDWASHLNVGRLLTATGNSDTHGSFGRAGYPRNYLFIPGASAGNTDANQVKDAVLNRRVVVAGNVFVRFTDGKLPGDTVTVSPNVASDFGIQIQTPPYAVAEKLAVVVNGDVVQEIDISGNDPTAVIDFDGFVQITTDVDAWVSFVALGPRISAAVHSNRHVFGFTNAIILDVDNDGMFTPPGPKSMDFITPFNTFFLCQ